MADIQTAKGVRDIPPVEKALKNKVVNVLTSVFELYGFRPLETPILERYETLSAKFAAGEVSDALKETFRLTDQGERALGLRFDLTVPLARYVAMNPTLKMPFKRYELGQVFRDGPVRLGRYREFWQCDVDTIGSTSMLADAEVLAVVSRVFSKLGLDVVVKVSNRRVLNGILVEAGVTDCERAIIAIDKLDKIGVSGVSKELSERGFSAKQIEGIFKFVKEGVSLKELQKGVKNAEAVEGLKELEELFLYLNSMGVTNVLFDVSLARGLAYYTGTVYEAVLRNGVFRGSLAGGGRWDNMIGNFMGSKLQVPAVGVAFGLEPIMDVLKMEQKVLGESVVQVYVLPIGVVQEGLMIVEQLRAKGIPAEVCLGKKGVSKNLDYASALGVPYVVMVGEDELKQKKVKLRDMKTGTEQLLTVNEVVKKLK